MGDLISLGTRAWAAKGQWVLDNASANAEKLIGTTEIAVQNMLNEVNANIENALRGENNALLAARAALGNFQKSAKSEAILRSAGAKYNAAGTNIARIADKTRGDTLERRIQAAEQQGAATAAFAASGTGGTTQMMLKTAMAATAARRETRIGDRNRQQTYDMLAQQAGIMPGAVTQLDQGQVFAAIDHTKTTAQTIITPMWQADFRPTMEGQVWNTIAGQAGAVIGNRLGRKSDSGKSDWWESNSTDLDTSEKRDGYLEAFDRDGGYYGASYGGYDMGGSGGFGTGADYGNQDIGGFL